MKIILSILTMILLVTQPFALCAQKIKLKQGLIYYDDTAIMKFEKRNMGREILLFPLEGDQELIYMEFNLNGTPHVTTDNFIKIHFIDQDLIMENRSRCRSTVWKPILKWLAENDVFDKTGTLQNEKIRIFVDRFDENITNRTILRQ